MGLRSWLTPIKNTGADWKKFKRLIDRNPYAYGVDYIIDITADVPILSDDDIPLLRKGLWVAWSGDTRASLDPMGQYKAKTLLLDNVLDYIPRFRNPTRFGTIFEPPCENPGKSGGKPGKSEE